MKWLFNDPFLCSVRSTPVESCRSVHSLYRRFLLGHFSFNMNRTLFSNGLNQSDLHFYLVKLAANAKLVHAVTTHDI